MRILKKYLSVLFIGLIVFTSCEEIQPLYLNPKPPVAEAGNPKTILLPVSFDTLRGTAISYNGPVYGYLWSLISGPNVPHIASPSSPNTSVSNLISGVYKFQFAVIDSAGLTGIDTTSITVINQNLPVITLVLQPHNNLTESHILLLGANTDQSNQQSPEICAGAWTNGGTSIYIRGLVKFDLSSIPANATITSATLSLYTNPTPINGDHVNANAGTANAMYIERNTSSWTSAVNWMSQPSTDQTNRILIPHTNDGFLDVANVDVKNMVTTMTATNNDGFKIRLQNEQYYNIRNFCSSKHADFTKHPKLVITYQ